ncbi:ThiF family adenylyltransferase [Bacillus haynesii]|uniref:ThiF family adenylyltransferase n=1 Tax=Bacillus haynesii TaxID=1925021 RepID=UPI0022813D88|nr:ThiF family adenylyltransferase [Bacillus haynesii]MCY8577580.1 ThiF family adenylyltransferase [Bacillus haynesii]MEC1657073.1 ThiF family adenylyltransferase [Bacillus haynesii]
MFHPVFKLSDALHNCIVPDFFFNIVQIGAGGNGGYLVQRLSKLLYSLSNQNDKFYFNYQIVDGDRVEKSNLFRQPFIEQDLNQPKSQILAERYDNAYEIPILYKDDYIESSEDIEKIMRNNRHHMRWNIPILLGCVDNNATRQIMHEVFQNTSTIIYIDSGIDSVDEEGSKESGYSGQVVCGVKIKGKEYLSPVGSIYPNILKDKDTRLPTQACGEQVVYFPQRMQTNEVAALVMMGYLNTLLHDKEIVSHYTNFNARTMLIKPTYIVKEQLEYE